MTTTRAKTRRVAYVDLAAQHRPLKAELMAAVERVLDHGKFILGEEVREFETKFAELCGAKFAVGVSSGTDALILALRALDIGPGDEVITAPNSFVASASCIALVGAKPVFVDVADDYTLDAQRLEAAITKKTKAILPVHLTGRPCDMDAIMAIAKKHGLAVVEDSAQAVLAEHRGKRVGSFGDMGCFSLHPLKTLNACGDAGIATTSDPAFYEKLLLLRNIGLKTRDDCVLWSGNSRIDTMQAAMLLVKLKHLEDWTRARRKNAEFYRRALADVPQVQLPIERPHERAVYHTFVVQAERRDELKAFLSQAGVDSAIHYPIPIHLHRAAASLGLKPGAFPIAERQARKILSLPVHHQLTQSDLNTVVETIKEFYR